MTLEQLESTPSRALAIFAHPDDCDVACGGTVAKWAEDGCEVHLVICAIGDKGSADPATVPSELVERRAEEVVAAQKVLGIHAVHRLSYRDGEFENDLVFRQELVGIMRQVRPEVLLCPDPLAVFFGEHYYNHRDHRVVGFGALDAASPAAGSPHYFPDQGAPYEIEVAYLSGTLEPNVFVDISTTVERKADAVMCHKSQIGEAGESMRELFYDRSREAGRRVGVSFAEAFRRIRLGH